MKTNNAQFVNIIIKTINKKKGPWFYEVKNVWSNVIKDIVDTSEAILIATKKTDKGIILKVACIHSVISCVISDAKKIILKNIIKNINIVFYDLVCITNTRYFFN